MTDTPFDTPNEISIEKLTKEDRERLMLTLQNALGSGELSPSELMIIRYEACLRDTEEQLSSLAQLSYTSSQVVQVALGNIMSGAERFIPKEDQDVLEDPLV